MSLRDRLATWFKNHPGLHASGSIQRMVSEKTTYTPSNTSRRLRELEVDGTLKVEYKDGHAYYKYNDLDKEFRDF